MLSDHSRKKLCPGWEPVHSQGNFGSGVALGSRPPSELKAQKSRTSTWRAFSDLYGQEIIDDHVGEGVCSSVSLLAGTSHPEQGLGLEEEEVGVNP